MALLVIDEKLKEELSELKSFAERNPYTMDDLLDIKNGEQPAPGDVKSYYRIVPVDVKVVYTVELQNRKIKHLSVSARGRTPHPEIVKVIMEELGFSPVEKCYVYFEGPSVNVMEEIV